MRVEEFKQLSDAELRQRANECLAIVDVPSEYIVHAAKLLQAQLYMNEISRRNDEKIAIRDGEMADRSFKMEIWVIVLIGIEILIGVGGIAFGFIEGNKQATILDDMKKSTAATAATLQTQGTIFDTINGNTAETAKTMEKLQKAQDASLTAQQNSLATLKDTLKSIGLMDVALQQQLNLAFAVSITITADESAKSITVANLTKTAVYIVGAKYDNEAPSKFADARFIPPNANYSFFLETIFKSASEEVPRGSQRKVPLDLYVQSADGQEYVAHGLLLEKWENEVMKIYTTITSVKPEKWPAEVR